MIIAQVDGREVDMKSERERETEMLRESKREEEEAHEKMSINIFNFE